MGQSSQLPAIQESRRVPAWGRRLASSRLGNLHGELGPVARPFADGGATSRTSALTLERMRRLSCKFETPKEVSSQPVAIPEPLEKKEESFEALPGPTDFGVLEVFSLQLTGRLHLVASARFWSSTFAQVVGCQQSVSFSV